jgi:[acyl-carrier-protein] S-malonyltransferase
LPVGGAFTNDGTSKKELIKAIEATKFSNPICPVYQNVTAKCAVFKRNRNSNLIMTNRAKMDAICKRMIADGATSLQKWSR